MVFLYQVKVQVNKKRIRKRFDEIPDIINAFLNPVLYLLQGQEVVRRVGAI